MNWAGDIYLETSGDYAVKTDYSYLGSFTYVKYRGKVIRYARDAEEGKRIAEEHARKAA